MSESICYVNGEFCPASEAKISVFDRGFTGGEGVYDVTRSFGHKPFKLNDHVARLYRSLRYTHIDCGITLEEMTRLSLDVFERNKPLLGHDDDCAVWQVITRGKGWYHSGPPRASVVIFCVPVAFENFARDYIEGCPIVIPSTRRTPSQSLEAKAKITNKMNHVIAAYEAKLAGARATPLMLDIDGNISETHMGNFFFVSGGKLCTSSEKTVLGGITRSTIIKMAGEMGIGVVEGDFTPYDVYSAEEAFTASTSPTMVPVKSLNGSPIGNALPGPVTLRLIKAWNAMVGIDIVGQALSHLADRDKQHLLGEWERIRSAS
jgi:branched-chain amino acid aminotransferase